MKDSDGLTMGIVVLCLLLFVASLLSIDRKKVVHKRDRTLFAYIPLILSIALGIGVVRDNGTSFDTLSIMLWLAIGWVLVGMSFIPQKQRPTKDEERTHRSPH